MTNATINPPEETPGCDCGALLEQGQIRCRKCLARDRWTRRQTARRKENKRRAVTRRPPRGPIGFAQAGVIWS
ncbi:hypothetical protein [Microtetraspora niveoalba]|uniref:hypothetical protein n=1 Tax=Microtetraspora niveoalba TaxID=46175 RepID=UPI00082E08DA|nr:hypothetical protein [Microtetraspora niveoalba]